MSPANQHHERPSVAPDQPVPVDRAADMSEPNDLDDYEPVDPDPEAVIDEVTGGPVDAEDADEAYPHEARDGDGETDEDLE